MQDMAVSEDVLAILQPIKKQYPFKKVRRNRGSKVEKEE